LAGKAANRVRIGLGLSGLAALVFGILIIVWPDASAISLAWLLGIYWIIAGVGYVLVGIFTAGMRGWSRFLDIVLGVLMVVVGLVVVTRPAESAVILGVFVGVFLGVLWIVEGVIALIQSADMASRGWAILFGVVSILGGIAVLTSPLWGLAVLFLFAGFMLVALGVFQIIRAFQFGRRQRSGAI
jgi:uncharacterized membrane protein HdeD (DUF308 family)